MSIEEMFDIDLPDKVAESISDIDSAVQVFHKQLNQKNEKTE